MRPYTDVSTDSEKRLNRLKTQAGGEVPDFREKDSGGGEKKYSEI
jgi:hypothetical protein